jgi:glycine/D-amino acid oxidase-like deaminating enzyme
MTTERYDLIIVGGGAIGLASAYHAAKRAARILLLEQHDLFHDHTSSSGASRQFRLQYNDRATTQLVLESIPLWTDLQALTHETLWDTTGCLWFGDPQIPGAEGQISTVIDVMTELGLPYEELSSQQIEQRFAFVNLPHHWRGFIQPHGAASNVRATLRTLQQAAAATGATDIRPRQRITGLTSGTDGVRVETHAGNTFHASRLILAPGPGVNSLLRLLGVELNLTLWAMTSAYFRSNGHADYPTWITFQNGTSDDPGLYYGFPSSSWDRPGLVRVAANYPSEILAHISAYTAEPNPGTIAQISNWVTHHMPHLDPEALSPSSCVCALLTDPAQPTTLSREMVVDFAPETVSFHRNIVLCATGWVFKIAPLLGKICVDLALDGSTPHDIANAALAPGTWHPIPS